MTLSQLEYVVAVDTYRHFATAAKKCFVAQPTLSMQIRKLEEELGVKIFDRSKQPVVPTEVGMEIIRQARAVLKDAQRIGEIVTDKKGVLQGELRLAVIPTLAPYLIPLFLQGFLKKYPQVKCRISELTTEQIVLELKDNRIDAGLLATPLNDAGVREQPLFYEEFVVYVSKANPLYAKRYVLASDIDVHKLWLLEEGHCFRSQIFNLCELRKNTAEGNIFEYESGSVETLRRMVERSNGITILPELATLDLSPKQLTMVRYFKSPAPVREISLVTHRDFVKQRLIGALKEEVIASVPEKLHIRKNRLVVSL